MSFLTSKLFKRSALVVLISCSVILLCLHRDKTPRESGGHYVEYYWPSLEVNAETPGDPKTVALLSQHPDIEERGRWQRKQVESYCRKYKLERVEYQFPRDQNNRQRLFRHLIFDDKRKLLFAYIPKACYHHWQELMKCGQPFGLLISSSSSLVGCTNMRRFLFVLQGVLPDETIHWKKVSEDDYIRPGLYKASFLKKELTDLQRMEKVKMYYKFTIVRNPLERLLSAYRNKIEPLLKDDSRSLIERLPILYKYGLLRWKASRWSFDLRVSFSEYIQWVVDTRNEALDPHFAPVIDNIYPCRIKYDFYGNFKTLGEDVAKIVEKLQAPPDYFHNVSYHKAGRETRDFLEEYYAQVDKELKLKLFHDFYQELDFYYHLYPEERTSNMKLLEVEDKVM